MSRQPDGAGPRPGHGRRTGREVLSLAPMMELTDRHFRYLLRLVTRRTLLYTEMVTAQAVLFGDQERLLGKHEGEGRVALQLGGSDPEQLSQAARIGEDFGYAEVNLNVGCPSERVKSGSFGACLMADPPLVAECVAAMREAVRVPVTVKHRIGIDDKDSYEFMRSFVQGVAYGGPPRAVRRGPAVDAFTVHARKAWLTGLSPKENRTVPPLRYGEVHRLKLEMPELVIELNGGVTTLDEAREHLRHVDGVMIGRALYEDPLRFAGADALVGEVLGVCHGGAGGAEGGSVPGAQPAERPEPRELTARRVVEAMVPYIDERMTLGTPLHAVTRHMLGLFRGRPGGKVWRRLLTEGAHASGGGPELLRAAMAALPDHVLDAPLGPAKSGAAGGAEGSMRGLQTGGSGRCAGRQPLTVRAR